MEFAAKLAAQLVAINSENPPGREAEAARFFAEKAAENGLKARVIDHGQGRASALVELFFGEGRTIVYNSHLDTVPAGPLERWKFHPFTTGVKDGYVFGRGSVDAKGCLAAMLTSLASLEDEKLSGRVVLMAVADEEVGGMGSLSLMKEVGQMDYVVVGEPTSLQLCAGSRGRTEVTLHFYGKPTHASTPTFGVNAATAAAKTAVKIAKLEKGYGPKNRLFPRNTATVTVFESGLKPNVVPDQARLVIDFRNMGEKPAATLRTAVAIAKSASPPSVKIRGAVTSHIPSYITDIRGKLVKECREAMKEAGIRPLLRGLPAATDLNRMNRVRKVDGVIFGPGDLRLAHSFREKVAVKELAKAADFYRLLLLRLLR
ncbi:MAG: M20/M25/M40 family metallo-hydrolase [Candidatus Caldarchaeum sp.]